MNEGNVWYAVHGWYVVLLINIHSPCSVLCSHKHSETDMNWNAMNNIKEYEVDYIRNYRYTFTSLLSVILIYLSFWELLLPTWFQQSNDSPRHPESGGSRLLRRIFSSVYENGLWCIGYNNELYELFSETDIDKTIKIGRLRWASRVIWILDYNSIKEQFHINDSLMN
jgi:hypothetical protein